MCDCTVDMGEDGGGGGSSSSFLMTNVSDETDFCYRNRERLPSTSRRKKISVDVE